MLKKRNRFLLMALLLCVLVLGCESSDVGGGNSKDGGSSQAEEITLQVFNRGAGFNNEEIWEEIVFGPVQAHHPHIDFEIVEGGLEENITAGVIPDIIFENPFGIYDRLEDGLV